MPLTTYHYLSPNSKNRHFSEIYSRNIVFLSLGAQNIVQVVQFRDNFSELRDGPGLLVSLRTNIISRITQILYCNTEFFNTLF